MRSIVSSANVTRLARYAGRRSALAWLLTLLPLAAFLLYALASPGLTRGAGAGTYITAAALLAHGRPALDGAIGALAPAPIGADAPLFAYGSVAYAAGHYQQTAPPGPALLAVPAYGLGLLLAPVLGADTPVLLTVLLAALIGALAIAGLTRLVWRAFDPPAAAALAMAGLLLLRPLTGMLTGPLLAATIVIWTLPVALAFWRGEVTLRAAFGAGLGLAALGLADYVAGALAAIVILVLLVRSWRVPGRALALLAGAALPALVQGWYGTVAFGRPWGLGFRYAVDPAARGLLHAGDPLALGAIGGAMLVCVLIARLHNRQTAVLLAALALMIAVPVATIAPPDAQLMPVDWATPAAFVPVVLLALAVSIAPFLAGRVRVSRRAALPAALLLAVLLAPFCALPVHLLAASVPDATNYAAPFAIESNGAAPPVWTVGKGGTAETGSLNLAAGGWAESPWLDVAAGQEYTARVAASGAGRLLFAWYDAARQPAVAQAVSLHASGDQRASFAAPPRAAGLRLRFESAAGTTRPVTAVQLTLAAGARVEPFPDYNRAAFAFSFDWESAMGGLIHTRSSGEGEGATVGLQADGGPSVADAEAKALRMRDGARFLADQFARYGIHATFYATGYDLLPGNPTCEKFLGNPIYRNADEANGWGSNWWQTHPWYENDPCSTEAQAPAWYFASETRELANEGHEIGSHTFGHLYVRGVEPAELAADLAQWNRSAEALGLPPATSFAFPWTSSNSLDAPFFAVFEQQGLTILTRVYPPDLRHQYELDREQDDPNITIFPDFYLPSRADALDQALAGIDLALAGRGYFSVWTHPNEVLEQGGQVIWTRAIDYAAQARDRGLWVAPVSDIVRYGQRTRQVAVTALPVAGGTRLVVENQSGQALSGLTLSLPDAVAHANIGGQPWTDTRGAQLRLTVLPPNGSTIVRVSR
ncbi:MAG: polysaccharide deacetylase family protein [Thermomicrobiales bacterium]